LSDGAPLLDQLPLRLDVLLLLAAAGLYLVDNAQLLFANEVLFVRKGAGAWSARFPGGAELLGRFPVLVEPLQPGRPAFRAAWPTAPRPPEDSRRAAEALEQALAALAPIKYLAAALLPQAFVVLPAAYWWSGANVLLVSGLAALIYVQAIAMAVVLLVRKPRLNISWRTAVSLAFESLVCPPYAINLYKKAAMAASHSIADVLVAAEALLPKADRAPFYQKIAAAANDLLQWNDGSARAAKLIEFCRTVEEKAKCSSS